MRHNVLTYTGAVAYAYKVHRHTDIGKILADVAAHAAVHYFYYSEICSGRNIGIKGKSLYIYKSYSENGC